MKYCQVCGEFSEVVTGNFCPKCGAKGLKKFDVRLFLEEDKVSAVIPIRKNKKCTQALQVLEADRGYQTVGSGKYAIAIFAMPMFEAHKIPGLLKGLQFSLDYSLYEGKKKLAYNSCLTDPAICIYKRSNDERPISYCYGIGSTDVGYREPNLIGCRQMGLEVGEHLNFGFWGYPEDVFGNYVYEKEKKVKKVRALLSKYRLCPHLKAEVIEKLLNLWPERINTILNRHVKPLSQSQIVDALYGNVNKGPSLFKSNDGQVFELNLPDHLFEPPPSYFVKHPAYCSNSFYKQLIANIYEEPVSNEIRRVLDYCLMEINIRISRYRLR